MFRVHPFSATGLKILSGTVCVLPVFLLIVVLFERYLNACFLKMCFPDLLVGRGRLFSFM